MSSGMKRTFFLFLATLLFGLDFNAQAQKITDAGYSTIAHVKSDGTIQSASYSTIGHIKNDGTVQDASYRTIGHAPGISKAWMAYLFFFL